MKMLEDASANNFNVIDVSRKLDKDNNEEQNARRIGALFGKFMYNSCIIAEDDGMDDKSGGSQIDHNPQKGSEEHIQKRGREAANEGM